MHPIREKQFSESKLQSRGPTQETQGEASPLQKTLSHTPLKKPEELSFLSVPLHKSASDRRVRSVWFGGSLACDSWDKYTFLTQLLVDVLLELSVEDLVHIWCFSELEETGIAEEKAATRVLTSDVSPYLKPVSEQLVSALNSIKLPADHLSGSTMIRHTLRRSSWLLSAPSREYATKTLFTAQALVKGGRADGDVTSDDGNLALTLGLPKAMGGPGKHTNPEQLFAAGYAACFQGAIGLAAKNNKVSVKGSSIDSHVSLQQDDKSKLNIKVEFDIKLEGVDKETAEKVVKDAHEICPYSNATRGNIDFKWKIV